jgi:prepilin-type N-terminal cleavage/methylation domain-containing protein
MQTMMTKKINKTTNQSTKAQKGFSLIELSMVIAVIALLLIAANFAFTSVQNNLAVKQATEELEFHFPIAVQQCQYRRGPRDLTECDTVAQITAVSTLSSDATPFGDTWTVAAVTTLGAPLIVVYPLDSAPNPDTLGPDLATKLNLINRVSAAYAAAANDITVTYQP